MGDVVHTLSNLSNPKIGLTSPLSSVGNALGIKSDSALGKNLNTMDSWTNPVARNIFGMSGAGKPAAPGINNNLGTVQSAQLANAANFRQNLPGLENQMGHQLADQSNQQMSQNIQGARQNNSARGLLYGGINAGQEGAIRANAAHGLAAGRSDINQGLLNNANTLDAQAIHTGLGIQQTQQSIQNSIYGQALADMQARGAAIGGLMGGVGKIGGMFAAGA